VLHDTSNSYIEYFSSGVFVRDFMAEAVFYNPYPLSRGGWDYGFFFRDTGGDDQYRLIVESSKDWKLYNGLDDLIDEGSVPQLDVSTNGSNTLTLVASGATGLFYVNGQPVATLDLSERLSAGDVDIATGIYEETERAGAVQRFEDFTIRAIDELEATATPPSIFVVPATATP
jgi:hypothetical protein